MVQSLLKGDLFARMQASTNCRREMYVGAQFGEVTVWGYVDAVFVNPDGTLTLVDFKTDTLITSPAELARRYQPQMSAYVAALQQATGMPVSEAWLVGRSTRRFGRSRDRGRSGRRRQNSSPRCRRRLSDEDGRGQTLRRLT